MQHGVGKYDGRGYVGENLAMGSAGWMDGARAVDMWYNEVGAYERSPGGFSMDTGHFTQVISYYKCISSQLILNFPRLDKDSLSDKFI